MTVNALNYFTGLITKVVIAGSDIGGTGESLGVRQESTEQKLKSGQSHLSQGSFSSEKSLFIDLSFAEYTLKNIMYALAQASGNLTGTTYLLLTGANPSNVSIYMEIYNEQLGQTLYANFPTCKVASGTNVTWDTTTQGFIPVTFEILANASNVAGHMQTPA